MQLLSQRDTRWATKLINEVPGSTIGRYGCTITSIGILLGKNPDDIETFLRANKGFLGDKVIWSKVPYFRHRWYCQNVVAPVDEIKTELRRHPVLLVVHMNGVKQDHWVLAIDENFTIIDPWDGVQTTLQARYGSPAKAILGGAYFDYPPDPIPEIPASEFPKMVQITGITERERVRVRVQPDDPSTDKFKYLHDDPFEVINRVTNKDGIILLDTKWGYVAEQFTKEA